MTDLHGLQETPVHIRMDIDTILDSIPNLSTERHHIDDDVVVVVFGRRKRPLLGLMQEDGQGGITRLLMHHPNDIGAMVEPLRRIGVVPDLLDISTNWEGEELLDLDALRKAVAYPFPDEPNAEVCVITGTRANARVHADGRWLSGWYGSTIADMTQFAVVDRTLPIGPICDDEIRKAIAAGKVVEIVPIAQEDMASTPSEIIAAQIEVGISITEDLLKGEGGGFPVGRMIREGDDMVAQPFAGLLQGHRGEAGVDLVGIGRLMALVARARAKPLTDAKSRTKAVAQVVERLKGDILEEMLLAPPEDWP